MALSPEPRITINGMPLSEAQAMTVRVAVGSLWDSLLANGLGDDEMGKSIASGYMERSKEIFVLMGLR